MMKSKISRLYIYQQKGLSLEQGIKVIEDELRATERNTGKEIYQYYDYALGYSIPLFDEEIMIFPIDEAFNETLLAARYTTNDFPEEKRKVIDNLTNRAIIKDRASFLIELPEKLNNKQREYIIKLLGICFGGHFSKLENLPRHGVLNKNNHLYIEAFRKEDEDILDSMETTLKRYILKSKEIAKKKEESREQEK